MTVRSILALVTLLFTGTAFAVTDNEMELVIGAGETYSLHGHHRYGSRVRIEEGGTLFVNAYTGEEGSGALSLEAPVIEIFGEINAQGRGFGGGAGGMNNSAAVVESYAQGGAEGGGGRGGHARWGNAEAQGGGGGGGSPDGPAGDGADGGRDGQAGTGARGGNGGTSTNGASGGVGGEGYGGGGGGGGGGNAGGGGGGGGGTGGDRSAQDDGGAGAGAFGGTGGGGDADCEPAAGGNGGYAVAGRNGDTSQDNSVEIGSGGGGAGSSRAANCGGGGGGGGAGGGAVSLVASERLVMSGEINTMGAGGGQSGARQHSSVWGGGGAGGGVLLQGPEMTLDGRVDQRGRRGNNPSRVNAGTLKIFHGALVEESPTLRNGRVLRVEINRPPIVSCDDGVDHDVIEGQTFTLALNASDPDGEAITAWGLGEDAPAEASVEGEGGSATLTWAPGHFSERVLSFEVHATDENGLSGRLMLSFQVEDANGPPRVVGAGHFEIDEDVELNHPLYAEDPDGDVATLELGLLPVGATYDAETRVFRWTPTNEQVGEHQIALTAEEREGEARVVEDILTLVVKNTNDAPILTTPLNLEASGGDYLEVTLRATDPDVGDNLFYWTLMDGPGGMTLGDRNGVLAWEVPESSIGESVPLRLSVADDHGGRNVYDLTVEVSAGPDAPIAHAGEDQESGPGLILLDGSRSVDPGGSDLVYTWRQVVNDTAPLVRLPEGSMRPEITLSHRGIYRFELRVHNGRYRSTPSFVNVTIINVEPVIELPDNPRTAIPVGTHWLEYLDGSSAYDPNPEDQLTYQWEFAGDETSEILPLITDPTASWTAVDLPGRGEWPFRLTVSDGEFEVSKDFVISLVAPDDGLPEPPTEPEEPVGCGCSSAPDVLPFAAAMFALFCLRRRRQRERVRVRRAEHHRE